MNPTYHYESNLPSFIETHHSLLQLQIWDFGSGDKIKDVPRDHVHSCQVRLTFVLPQYNVSVESTLHSRVGDSGSPNKL